MKRIFLILAFVGLWGMNAWADNIYSKVTAEGPVGELSIAALDQLIADNGSATIALGIVSSTSASYGTTDGINYYFSADADKVKTLEDKNVFTVTKNGDNYVLMTQAGGYIQAGNNGTNVTTGTVDNAAQFSLTKVTPGDYYEGYADANMIRFTQNGTYLNCQDKGGNAGWRTGTGGYSAFIMWQIDVTAPTTKTYTCHVTGTTEGRVIYDGTEYADGATFEAELDKTLLSAKTVDGYTYSVNVNETDITATYSVDYSFEPATYFANKVISVIGDELTEAFTANPGQWYLVKQNREVETPIYDNGANANIMRAAEGVDVNVNDAAIDVNKYLVRFVEGDYEGTFKIQFGTSRYFGTTLVASTTPGNYFVYPATQTNSSWTGHFAMNLTTDGTTYGSKVDTNPAGSSIAFWETGKTTSGANNVWAIYPVTLNTVDFYEVTYNYNYNGVQVDTETKNVLPGAAFPAPKSFEFAEALATPEGTVNQNETRTFEVNFTDFPFVLSENYANATWYTIKTRNSRYAYYDGTNTSQQQTPTAETKGSGDEYKWAFVGTPVSFKIINKGAGDGMYLKYRGELLNEFSATEYTDYVAVADNNVYDGDRNVYIRVKDMANCYFNLRNNQLAYWNSASAKGETGSALALTIAKSDLEEALDAADLAMAHTFGTALGEYSLTGVDLEVATVKSLLESVRTAYEGGNLSMFLMMYASTLTSMGYTADEAGLTSLCNDIAAAVVINQPAVEKFYRVKGGVSGNYVTLETAGSEAAMVETADEKTILYLNADHQFVSYNSGLGMIETYKAANVGQTKETVSFQASNYGEGKYCLQSNFSGSKVWYDQETKVNRNSVENSANCSWTLEEVTELPVALTEVAGENYATLYLPVGATVSDADVYVVNDGAASEGLLETVQVSSNEVPANTGVILVGTSTSATVTLGEVSETATSALQGVTALTEATENVRVFSKKDGENVVGFYVLPASTTTLKAFHAYYETSNSEITAFELNWGGTTGITNALTKKSLEGAYDLQGRKVNNAVRGGLYIIDGKKVIK